jgi:thymidylate synthase
MYYETLRDLKEMGVTYITETVQDQKVHRNTKELYNYAFTLLEWHDLNDLMKDLKLDLDWAFLESIERRIPIPSNLNPGEAWLVRKDFWKQFIHKDTGKFSYTYGERFYPQLERIILELISHPSTRQAILQMYETTKDLPGLGGRFRVPCTMQVMRSCDFHKFFLYDVYQGIRMLEHISSRIRTDFGTFTHFIGSLHVFEEDVVDVF